MDSASCSDGRIPKTSPANSESQPVAAEIPDLSESESIICLSNLTTDCTSTSATRVLKSSFIPEENLW